VFFSNFAKLFLKNCNYFNKVGCSKEMQFVVGDRKLGNLKKIKIKEKPIKVGSMGKIKINSS